MISFRKIKSCDLKFFIEIRNECADWLDDNTRFTLQIKTFGEGYVWQFDVPDKVANLLEE